MRYTTLSCFVAAFLAITACSPQSVEQSIMPLQPAWSGDTAHAGHGATRPRQSAGPANPRILPGKRGLQCVPYAREQSGISIRGDAWTWWRQAKGKYHRSGQPSVGAVLVVSKTAKNKYGHLAVVTRIVNEREIIVNHANWLSKGRIHLDTPVRDVSPRNDWSAVRFWYTPGNVLGKSAYPVSGFIYPRGVVAASK